MIDNAEKNIEFKDDVLIRVNELLDQFMLFEDEDPSLSRPFDTFRKVYLPYGLEVLWNCQDGDNPDNHIWDNLCVQIYFPKKSVVQPILLKTLFQFFHKLQRINIISYVTSYLAHNGYKKVKIPRHLSSGAFLIGAHPGAMNLSTAAQGFGEKITEGELYPNVKHHIDPIKNFEKC